MSVNCISYPYRPVLVESMFVSSGTVFCVFARGSTGHWFDYLTSDNTRKSNFGKISLTNWNASTKNILVLISAIVHRPNNKFKIFSANVSFYVSITKFYRQGNCILATELTRSIRGDNKARLNLNHSKMIWCLSVCLCVNYCTDLTNFLHKDGWYTQAYNAISKIFTFSTKYKVFKAFVTMEAKWIEFWQFIVWIM